ncbi:MAG: TVP38/TMEM64 family protein, partial [Candidatus Asgardarchaeum californiense]
MGPLGFFIALILQAILAPIPSELMLFLGGAAYGPIVGGLVGGAGTAAGSIASFYISKRGGRPVVLRLVGEKTIAFADRWFERWGAWAVLIGRFIPFIPFDGVSYGAGLTKMRFRDFFIASTLGGFPRSIFYAYLGYLASQQINTGGLEAFFNTVSII